MELVLDIGNSFLAGAFFQNGQLKNTFLLPSRPLDAEAFRTIVEKHSVKIALIGSDQTEAGNTASLVLKQLQIPFTKVTHKHLSIILDVEKPEEVGIDRIANTYGA